MYSVQVFRRLQFFALSLAVCLGLSAADIASLNWEKAVALHPSILYVHAKLDQPRLMDLHVVRVDLQDKTLGFFTTPKPDMYGKPMPDFHSMKVVTKRQTCRNFMQEARKGVQGKAPLDMILAVNSSPWSPWTRPYTHQFAARLGLFISAGEVLDANDLGRPSFVVKKDGSYDFRSKNNLIPVDQIWIAVTGFSVVLDKNQLTAGALADKSLAPRTGYGLSKDRRYLYLAVIDGRQPTFSQGATTGDVGKILQQMGAWDALNMDGGGSSSLVYWDERFLFLKKPSPDTGDRTYFFNHQPGGGERRNGTNLGIYRKQKSN